MLEQNLLISCHKLEYGMYNCGFKMQLMKGLKLFYGIVTCIVFHFC